MYIRVAFRPLHRWLIKQSSLRSSSAIAPASSSSTAGEHATLRSHTRCLIRLGRPQFPTLIRYEHGALACILDLSIPYPSRLMTALLCLLLTPQALLLFPFLLLPLNLALHSYSSLFISNDLIVQPTT